jgi:hypothetical protein
MIMIEYDVHISKQNVTKTMCVVQAPNIRAAFNQVRTTLERDGGAFIPTSAGTGIFWPTAHITEIEITLRKS